MKRFKTTVCQTCNRGIRGFEQPRTYEGHTLCSLCHDILIQGTAIASFIKVRYAPYAWLTIPAILLGGIGLLGILMSKFEAVAAELSFLNMPPQASCYLIAAGAMILLVLSIIYRQSKEEIVFDKRVPLQTEERWRSV